MSTETIRQLACLLLALGLIYQVYDSLLARIAAACKARASSHRRSATSDQTASTSPNGHAP